jgi:hypothetical protein
MNYLTADNFKKLAILLVTLGLISVAYVYGKRESKLEVTKEYELKMLEHDKQVSESFSKEKQQLLAEYTSKVSELEKKIVQTEKETIFKKDGTVIVKEKTKTKSSKKKTATIAEKKEVKTEKVEQKSESKETVKVVDEKSKEKVVQETTSPPSWRVYGTALFAKDKSNINTSYGAGFMYDIGPFNAGAYGLYSSETLIPAAGVTLGVSF